MGKLTDWMFARDLAADSSNASRDGSLEIVRNEALPVADAPQSYVFIPAPVGLDFHTVANYGALMSVDYMSCEQTKARSLASIPFTVVKNGAKKEQIANHPIARLLNVKPNEAQTASEFFAWHRIRCDTFGTAYWRVEWYKGTPIAFWPVECGVFPDFNINRPEGHRLMYQLTGDDYNPAGNYFCHEIIAIKTHVIKNVLRGESLAEHAAREIGLGIDLERFYESMLKNGNHHLGHIEVPDKHMTPSQRDDLERALEAKSGVRNSGKAPIFAAGAKWIADGQTMKDASVIEQQQWVLKQVCRATNVSPWKVYETEGVAYQGGQQANIDYVTETVLPDVREIEQAVYPILRVMGHGDCDLRGNLKGLMRGDDAARSQYYREMAYAGVYTPKRICELEDVDSDGILDKPLFPLNYGTVESDGSVTVYSQTSKEPADGNQTGVTD